MHILLVEDDLELGAELQRALVARGFTSEWVRQIKDADAFVQDHSEFPYVCVLLDLGLPDGQGMDLLRRWRARGESVPVIVLTARDAVESRVLGLDSGADDYLIKPVAMEELASRIRAVARRAAGQAAAIWTVGGLQIDPEKREVRVDGRPVALSPKEFLIVFELARQSGKVVPKHRIAQAIAPLGQAMDFGALEFHIHNLRRKLGEDCVRTVRGVGYSIAE
jgi:two-component system, OmpR family, response regulator QseB